MKKLVLAGLASFMLASLGACENHTDQSSNSGDDKTSVVKSKPSNHSVKKSSSKSVSQSSQSSNSGGGVSLKSVVATAQSQMAQIKSNTGDTYSRIETSADGDDTLVYTMRLSQNITGYDKTSLKIALVKALQPSIQTARNSRPTIKLLLILQAPDGTVMINEPITDKEIQTDTQ